MYLLSFFISIFFFFIKKQLSIRFNCSINIALIKNEKESQITRLAKIKYNIIHININTNNNLIYLI